MTPMVNKLVCENKFLDFRSVYFWFYNNILDFFKKYVSGYDLLRNQSKGPMQIYTFPFKGNVQ